MLSYKEIIHRSMFGFVLEVKPATKFNFLEELIPSSVPRKLKDLEITRVHHVEGASDWFLPCSINSVYYKHAFPETNIAPENRPSQKETSIPTIRFQVLC